MMGESETGRPAVYFQKKKKKKKQDTKTAVRNLCVKIIAKYWCSPQGLGKKKERTQGKKELLNRDYMWEVVNPQMNTRLT